MEARSAKVMKKAIIIVNSLLNFKKKNSKIKNEFPPLFSKNIIINFKIKVFICFINF